MKKIKRAAPLLALLLALTACQGGEPEPPPGWTVTLGDLTLNGPVSRVVTLSPGLTETVYALGYGGRVVGVSEHCDRPSPVSGLPRCGNARLPDAGAILGLNPQLVVSPVALPGETMDALAAASVQVLVVEWADDLEGVYRNYGTLCRAFEGEERGALREEQLRFYGDGLLAYIQENARAAQGDSPASAVWLRHLPLVMATGDTMEGGWLSGMGFVNPAGGYTEWTYPAEEAETLDPDVILCDWSIDAEALAADSVYRDTAAVAEDRIYLVDGNVFERQVPLMFSELARVAAQVFPDAYDAPRPPEAMPYEPPPAPEKTWLEKLRDRLGL